jgi:hypothetical protein
MSVVVNVTRPRVIINNSAVVGGGFVTILEGYKDDAEAAALAAALSEQSAEDDAEIATTQAGIATNQAGIATNQAGIATNQAGIATNQAGIATTQAGLAAGSAISAEASKNQAAAYASAADSAADRAEAVVVSGDVSFYPAPGKVPVARSTGQIDTNWIKGVQRPAQWLENVSGATGAVFPDDSESKMTPQQMLVFDPVFIPATLNGEITLFADGVMGVYITNDKKIRLNYYGAFETTQTIAVSDDWVTVTVVSDDNEQDTVSVFFLVNGFPFDVVQVGEFSPLAMRDVLGAVGFRWLFNPGMEYLTNANVNRVTLPGQAIGTVRDIGPNGLNGSQLTATARPLAGRVPVGGRRNTLLNTANPSASTWERGRVVVTAVSAPFEDAFEVRDIVDSSNQTHYLQTAVGTTAAAQNDLVIKAGTIRYVMLNHVSTGDDNVSRRVIFDLQNGTIVDSNTATGNIVDEGDGWYRISNFASDQSGGSSASRGWRITLLTGADIANRLYTGDGTGTIFIAEVQRVTTSVSIFPPQPYQRVGATSRDITEAGVPDVHYAYFDGIDDVISMTLPSSITGGTIIVAGPNGVWVDDNFNASAGTFNIGATTYTGGPAGLINLLGGVIGITVSERQLTESELEREFAMYKQAGAPGVFELGAELVTNGTFDADTNWNKGTGWTISGGTANGASSAQIIAQTGGVTVSAGMYLGVVDVVSRTSGAVFPSWDTGNGVQPTTSTTPVELGATGTTARIFTFGSAGQFYFGARIGSSNAVLSIDNVSLKAVTLTQWS